MILRKCLFRKNAATSLYVITMAAVLTTGCIVDPVTGQSRPDPKIIGALGAVAGGVAGGFVGNKIGGGTGAALGAALGVGLGGAAGYFISDYLNAREQQQYVADLNQRMKATPTSSTGSNSWINADRTKAVNTGFTEEVSLQKIGSKIVLNQQVVASLPRNTTCRAAKIQIAGQQTSDILSAYCRDANGDYIRADGNAV